MAKRAAKATKPKGKTKGKKRGPPQTLIQQSRQVPAELKALYHNVLGAGKSKVLRPFFDLNEADIDVIRERLQAGLERQIQKGA